MKDDIEAAKEAGLAGVVIGASRPDGRLDYALLQEMISIAGSLDITLHRAFDMAPDFTEALDQAASLGIKRILTSGGAHSAALGVGILAKLIVQAGDTITIMPGGGISAENAPLFITLGAREVHASCSSPINSSDKTVELGFALPSDRQTDPLKVSALKAALSG